MFTYFTVIMFKIRSYKSGLAFLLLFFDCFECISYCCLRSSDMFTFVSDRYAFNLKLTCVLPVCACSEISS